MVLAYASLLALTATTTTLAIEHLLHHWLNQNTDASLSQEIDELTLLLADGIDPLEAAPYATLERRFDVLLERSVPDRDEAFLTFIDGEVHSADLHHYPAEIPDWVLARWAAITDGHDRSPLAGVYVDDLGTARYRVLRTSMGDQLGAVVVTILPLSEHARIDDLTG
jgi:two-component system, OmpR family, sensor kinase